MIEPFIKHLRRLEGTKFQHVYIFLIFLVPYMYYTLWYKNQPQKSIRLSPGDF